MLPLRLRLLMGAGFAGLLVAACAVDSGPGSPPDPPAADAAAAVPDGAPLAADATPACVDAVPQVAETGHHPEDYDTTNGGGAGCMGQCHNGSGLGEQYTAAGSLWNRRTEGGSPIQGAYIYIIDGNGKVVELMTAQNGYFWTDEPLAAPLRTYASGCPSSLGMEDDTSGNCNTGVGGCHSLGNRIYLPAVEPGL
ncbi:MAG TPA: hypothetical protein VFU21_01480 [Kofleriaceae bacterium]|nr:hypothetical protein [Kofleriaceae bacterium]